MLKKGHIFVYGNTGVCFVEDICTKDCGAGKKEYYVLAPVYDSLSTIYVPTDAPAFESHAKELLKKEEVLELIDYFPKAEPQWIVNDKERAEAFRKLLESGERKDLVLLICSLYTHKTELAQKGKKLRSSDESIMQRAERLLFGEFAFVLELKPKEILPFIKDRIGY